MLNRNFGNYYQVHDHQQKLISYKTVVKKNDIINLPGPLMCTKSTWICLVHFFYTFSKSQLRNTCFKSPGLLCCTCPISWCTSHFLHWTNLVVSWLLGSFPSISSSASPFPNYENCMFSLGKRTGPVLCRDLIMLITPSSVFALFLFGV